MKNLANCKPSEFLKQTNRIRKSVDNWLKVTDIVNIRKRRPEIKFVPELADEDEKKAIIAENAKNRNEQVRQNLSDMLDEILDKHPDETLEVLALCCFVEPEDVDSHSMVEYLEAFNELVSNEAVISFFSLLMRVGQMST
jgi:hypothetical protein